MPTLKNARHEIFAQALARGATATDAYSQAGYKGDRTAASRLSTNVNIARRVDEGLTSEPRPERLTIRVIIDSICPLDHSAHCWSIRNSELEG